MFDNFTCQNEYHSYDVILQSNDSTGALLLGDFNSATDQSVLSSNSVKTVITSAAGLDHLQIPNSIQHIVYPLKDAKSQNIRAFFEESFECIDKKLKEGGVLVHCAAGVSRSATLIIAYLMKKNQMSFKQAINFVRSKRSGICPNLGFQLQLKKYESELQKKPNKDNKDKNGVHNQPKLMRKNVSERINDEKKGDIDTKQYQNKSLFLFQPAKTSYQIHGIRKKPELKKGTTKNITFSKPKERNMYDVMETELFVSGKGAKRPNSQVRDSVDKLEINKKNPMMGTWGPKQHRVKKFQF